MSRTGQFQRARSPSLPAGDACPRSRTFCTEPPHDDAQHRPRCGVWLWWWWWWLTVSRRESTVRLNRGREMAGCEHSSGPRGDVVGKLDVNLPDLSRAAADYAELQTRASAIGPQAVEEARRIIATHGPMGYPVAVGVVAGLGRRQGALDALTAQFGAYSARFDQHVATYSSEDLEAARRFDAIRFPVVPDGVVEPKPPKPDDGDDPPPPFDPAMTCWIGTSDGPTSACPTHTEQYLYVEDGTWMTRQVRDGIVAELPSDYGEPQTLLEKPPAPGTDPFAGLPPGTVKVLWPNPDGSLGGAGEESGRDHCSRSIRP